MKAFARTLIAVIIFVVAILALLSILTKHTYYQFSSFDVSVDGRQKSLIWISKTDGRIECSKLEIYKRNFDTKWSLSESSCVDGSKEVPGLTSVTYDEWLRGRFAGAHLSQAYIYFKDIDSNQNIIYFSDPGDLDPQILAQIGDGLKSVLTWSIVQPVGASIQTRGEL